MSSLLHFTTLVILCVANFAHAQVDWREWDDKARAEAIDRALPLYIVIGDPLSELTTSMRQDTFANAEVAAFLNTHFVCVYTDRDHTPGLAAYGQQWLAAEQKIPGWPLNLWFTPQLEPMEAASYLPPTEEWGREGFMVVANRVVDNWATGAGSVSRAAERRQMLIADYLPFAAEPVEDMTAALRTAAEDWLALLHSDTGLFGEPPHRPEPELIRFLLGQDDQARTAALGALSTRLSSRLRDPIDGGFYRATSDNVGGIPIFQKRLTDQARIALACLDAAEHSDDPVFEAGARSALDYAIRHLSPGDGTFWIGEDATSGEATKAQTWAWSELVPLIGETFATELGAQSEGNVSADEDLEGHHQGRNILQASPQETGSASHRKSFAKLAEVRASRSESLLKQTANVGAHGLMLHALRRAAAELDDATYREQATLTVQALRKRFGLGTNQFSRTADQVVPVTPTDFMLVVLGLGKPEAVQEVDDHYYDEEFGLYYATKSEVLGIQPLMWPAGPGELPNPGVWRLLLGNPPELLAAEVAAPFENPETPPSGDVLLALQHHHRSD